MHLVEKHNIPVPRYTSYATVPFWNNILTDNNGLNIHLPELFKCH
jgi:hypothetical protein